MGHTISSQRFTLGYMEKNKCMFDHYSHFINCRDQIIPSDLDYRSWKLLEYLYQEEKNIKKIRVTDVMMQVHQASSSTLHTKLMLLRRQGYISMAIDDFDVRVKYIFLTPKSLLIFRELNNGLIKINSK